MVIYLRHAVHGEKVASTEVEAAHDRENGWEDFVPAGITEGAAPAAPEVPPVEVPSALPKSEDVPPALPASEDVPAFLTPAPEVPAFLTGTPTPPSPEVVSDLPEDFPGRDLLIGAGYASWASVVDLSSEQLVAIKGIGPKTAEAILEKMNG